MSKKKPYDPNFKTCSKCKESFPRTKEFFYACKYHKNGLKSHCKQCCKEYDMENREHRRAAQKAWRQSERGKRYYDDNKEKRRAQKKERNRRKIEAMSEEERKQYREEKNRKSREYHRKNPHIAKQRYERRKIRGTVTDTKKQRQKMNAGIYKIICLKNNKTYIGGSTHYRQRRYQHKSDLKNNKHSNPLLQSDWNNFGEENFIFEVVEDMPPDTPKIKVRERELNLLKILNESGIKLYNVLNVNIKRRKNV